MKIKIDDPRLFSPGCSSLAPVETIHENHWFLLQNRGGYFTIEYKKTQVTVLPVVENHSIVMVRVNRPVLADITLELPGGGAEKNETPIETAARELAEETGIELKDLDRFKLLPSINISPNRYPVLPHLYQVHILQREYDRRNNHDGEIAGVECISFDEIKRMIVRGEIYTSLPIAIISRFFFQQDGNTGTEE